MKKDIVILINGTGGSGKSTFIKFCQNHVPAQWEVEEYSTVDWVKKVARFCGWNGGKTEKDRAFLHNLKETLQEWDDSPNQFVEKTIEYQSCLWGKSYVFFINVREIDNLIKLKKNYEDKGYFVYTLLIKNPSVPNILSNKADANVENYSYDEVIINKFDLQFLEDCAQKFMSFIIGYFSTKKDLLSN